MGSRLVCKRKINHREDWTLACEYAAEKKRHHGFLDIIAIEMARYCCAEFSQCGGQVRSPRFSGRLSGECACHNSGGGTNKKRSSFYGELGKIICGSFQVLRVERERLGGCFMLGHGVNSLELQIRLRLNERSLVGAMRHFNSTR